MSDNEIAIKVVGDTGDASSKLKGLEGDVKTFAASVNKAAEEVQKINPAAFKEIATDLNAGKISMTEFTKALEDVRAAASGAGAAAQGVGAAGKEAAVGAAAAGEAAHLSAGGMRELVVVAREVATGNFARLPGSLSILATRLGGIPPVAILAAAAIAGIGYAIYEAINSSEKFEAKLATIQNSLTAIGSGNSFDRSEITAYIDQLRQIPDIDREAAASITNEFARAAGGNRDVMRELVSNIVPFAQLIGKTVPEAAKEMAAAFNDPIKGLALLKAGNIEVSAATQEQVRQMMAVNNVAGAQQALFDGISVAMSHMVDNQTGLTKFWNELGADLDGVSIKALHAQEALLGAAAAAEKAGDADAARAFRERAMYAGSDARNLPNSKWSGGSGSVQSGDDKQAAKEKEDQDKKDNEILTVQNELFKRGGSLLAQQQEHKRQIANIQEGINAAERQHDDAALKRAYANLETENKKFYGEPKAEKAPRAPKDHSDRDFERELAEERKADQAEIEGNKRVADEKVRTQMLALQQKATLGQISVQDEIQQEIEAANQKQAIDLKAFDNLLSQYAADSAEYKKTLADKLIAEEKFTQQIMALQTKASQDQQRQDQQDQRRREQMFAPVTKAFDTSIKGMVLGTQTLSQSVSRLGQSIVAEFVDNVVHKMVSQWLLGESQKTISTEIGSKARQIADSEGTNKSVEDNILNTGKQQATDAVGVYSSVFNYLAPELGPFAAIPAALASASVLALSLPSAAGGMIVPNDTLAMVHENEMVLPARYTSGLTNMIDQANGGGGAGMTNHFHVNVNANGRLNAGDLDGLHDAVVGSLKKAARNGQFGGMRSA